MISRLRAPRDEKERLRRHAKGHRALAIIALIALALQSGMLFLALFEPPLPYKVPASGFPANDSEDYLLTLASLTGAGVYRHNGATVLTNGDVFYPAEIEAMRQAKRYIHVECYIFQEGDVERRVLAALAERARAGVEVRLLIDAIGSAAAGDDTVKPLRDAGGKVAWYHPVRWYTWPRINNRTHREMTVVDGTVGFAGGAGFADQWFEAVKKEPRWRDMMMRLEGDAATGLDAVFAENWLEATGHLLLNAGYFPFSHGPGNIVTLVVGSAPGTGRSTYSRVLFQSMIATARHEIHVMSPYFLPDRSLAGEIVKAVRRGVEVKILVPGKRNDHALTRTSSRRLYGDLLLGGARIYEYQPSMNHTKCLLIDALWSVVGSTNIDSRSFGLNDELNVALRDPAVAQRLEQDFENDLGHSREINYEQWKHRPLSERAGEWLGWLLERQQ